MIDALIWLSGLSMIGGSLFCLSFVVSSVWEKERRATVFGSLQLLVALGLTGAHFFLWGHGFFETPNGKATVVVLFSALALTFWSFFRITGANPNALHGAAGMIVGDAKPYDEREMVFSRHEHLLPGTQEYAAFYRDHPDLETRDAQRRAAGGLLGDSGAIDGPGGMANMAAIYSNIILPYYLSDPKKLAPRSLTRARLDLDPAEVTERIKGFARSMGADLVGITRIDPLWVYSHRGMTHRKSEMTWGEAIRLEHQYAVVFATEMAFEMVQTAPHTSTTIESTHNYAKGASIAARLAQYIANLGYSASVEMADHYNCLVVPLAVDAGLGELGRHGYLITKDLGPRVRLAGVTTDLQLVPDQPVDIGVQDFCTICKKCAKCCPSYSIPDEDQPGECNGSLRWKLNAESCYDFWAKVGTDCNICMQVCPWSHANTFPHNVITEAVSRSRLSRRFFLLMDDLFYGKRPKGKPAPAWADFRTKKTMK